MTNSTLCERHQKELFAGSGIDPELGSLNFRTVQDTEVTISGDASAPIDELLNRDTRRFGHKPRANESGWIFTGVDPLTGEPMDHGCYKPDVPRIEIRDGKERPIKYERPRGVPIRPAFMRVPKHLAQKVADRCGIPLPSDYRVEDFWKWVIKNNIPITPCEGEKKAACLLSCGYAAIGLPGINSGYRVKDILGNAIPPQLIRDLEPFATPGRIVSACFDHEIDPRTALKVASAAIKTGKLFAAAGCIVKIIQLPGPEKGVDDFIVAGGDFDSLHEEAKVLPAEDSDEKEPRRSQADILVALAESSGTQFFHNPDRKCYAAVPINGHLENYSLKSKDFRAWLMRLYWEACGKSPNGQSISDALGTLEGKALFDGPETQTYVRIAHRGEATYLDLGTPTWEVVEISASGWEIIPSNQCPVRFVRSSGMKAHPTPERGGKLSDLREFLNVDENGWILIAAWLVACFSEGPYCVLILGGEQGTGKTTTARLLRDLVDPAKATARSQPKEERDLAIAATNSWVVSFDNLSHVLDWLSDALCRLATGGGFSTRILYSDDQELILEFKRPCLLTGITDLATRSDLQDRSLTARLQVIPDDQRTEERLFLERFEAVRPKFLGALLDAVATAMARRPTVKLERKPRMADFAVFAVAAASAIGVSEKAVLDAIFANRDTATESVLEASPVAQAILRFLETRSEWFGTTGELLSTLTPSDRPPQGWPKAARALTNELKRLAPSLRAMDITWEPATRTGKAGNRTHALRKAQKSPSVPSVPSEENPEPTQGSGYSPHQGTDGTSDFTDGTDGTKNHRQPTVSQPSASLLSKTLSTRGFQKLTDGTDGTDGEILTSSNGHVDAWEGVI